MKILSFDPAAKFNMGVATIEVQGGKVVNSSARTITFDKIEDEKRPWLFFRCIEDLIKKEQPDVVILEKTDIFAGSKYIRSLITKCITIIECVSEKHGSKIVEYTPSFVKKTITGLGRASKEQIEASVKMLGPTLECDSEHAWDALAVGYSYLLSEGVFVGQLV